MKAKHENQAFLANAVEKLTAAAKSASTRESYRKALKHFYAKGYAIPCNEKQVAEYIAALATTHKVATIEHRLNAISQASIEGGHVSPALSPLVKRTMAGIRRTYGQPQRRVKALVKDDLLEALALSDQQPPLKAARDRALLLVGFAGAFRRSELVSLKVADLTYSEAGLDILLRRSKTDQTGQGRTVFIPFAKSNRCPIQALQSYLTLAGIAKEDSTIFRSVSRHDTLGKALSPQSVALIVKSCVGRVQGKSARSTFSGHSLRAGYVTQAAMVGLQPWQIKETTGHRSDTTLAKYIRPVQRRKIPSLL